MTGSRRRATGRAGQASLAAAAAVVAALTAAPALGEDLPPGGKFKGETNQHIKPNKVVFYGSPLSPNGYEIHWRAKCRGARRQWTDGTMSRAFGHRYPQHGRVMTNHGTYHGIYPEVPHRRETDTRVTFWMRARSTDDDHLQGTWRVRLRVYEPGHRKSRCHMATRWKASRVSTVR
jgi:hypothetical protein